MKKLLVFISILIVAISLKSCSSSDSDEIQYDGEIIGKWRLSQLFINNEDQQISECEKKMTIEVFENGTYTEMDYLYNDTDTACLLYDVVNGTWESLGNSNYKMSGLNTASIKVTFQDDKMIADYSEVNDGITFSIKTIFISDKGYVPDKIIGKWEQDQAFIGALEIELSACEKMGSVEFFEDGFFEEIAFIENSEQTECIELPLKTGMWKNIGNSIYYIYNVGIDGEIKITFENNKMYVEFSEEIEGIPVTAKIIFIKVSP
jgi:hypothetical protein